MIQTVVGLLVLGAIPVCRGLCQIPQPAFEVASLKPSAPAATHMIFISPYGGSQFVARNITLELLLCLAFGVQENQLSGLPPWAQSGFYDLTAKPEGHEPVSYEKLKPPLQALLAERFHLATHREKKEVGGYWMVTSKDGPKLTATAGKSGQNYIVTGAIMGTNVRVDWLAGMLTRVLHVPVADHSGIDGNYDISLEYAPEGPTESTRPSIFTAIKEQLGLRLEAHIVPLEILVVDRIEKLADFN